MSFELETVDGVVPCEMDSGELCCGEVPECRSPSEWFRSDEVRLEVYPELDCLDDVPAGPDQYHGEGSALTHTLMVADEMAGLRPDDTRALLAALAHDAGKCDTDNDMLPSHKGHAKEGVDDAKRLGFRLGVSGEDAEAMGDAARFHMKVYDVDGMNDSTVVGMVRDMSGALSAGQLVDLARSDRRGRVPEQRFDEGDGVEDRLGRASRAVDSVDERGIREEYGDGADSVVKQRQVERFRSL